MTGLSNLLVNTLTDVGFDVKTEYIEQKVTKTKQEAVDYIRNRSVSSWANLTDEQIEEGVKELDENYGDIVEYSTEREMIIATKKQ